MSSNSWDGEMTLYKWEWTGLVGLWDTNVCLFNTLLKLRRSAWAWIWILFCYFHTPDFGHTATEMFRFLFSRPKKTWCYHLATLVIMCEAVQVRILCSSLHGDGTITGQNSSEWCIPLNSLSRRKMSVNT